MINEVKQSIMSSISEHIIIEQLNNNQLKITAKVNHHSIYCFISYINNHIFKKGSLLLTDGGSSLLNTNVSDELSKYLAVCNFQLGYNINYMSKNGIKKIYHIKPFSKNKYELISVTSLKKLLVNLREFISIVATINSLNQQSFFD